MAEGLKEKIAKRLRSTWYYQDDYPDVWLAMADQILALIKEAGYKLDKDQSLPENPKTKGRHCDPYTGKVYCDYE